MEFLILVGAFLCVILVLSFLICHYCLKKRIETTACCYEELIHLQLLDGKWITVCKYPDGVFQVIQEQCDA